MEKLTVTDPVEGAEPVSILSDRVAKFNARLQNIVDEDRWPPEQPEEYTPLVLIQPQEHRAKEQVKEVSKLVQTGDTDLVTTGASGQMALKHHCKLDTAGILTTLEETDGKRFVLIEGAPGIGKSFLLKHIACQWGKKLLLTMFKIVFLVCLRDPNIQQVQSINELLSCLCGGHSNDKIIAAACSNLRTNHGEDIIFLFDGYDEFPSHLRNSSLIAKILSRNELCCSGIVVSSRPHATVTLRARASLKVDIMGFTEKDRQRFIKQALKDQPGRIDELVKYLQHHVTINSLCFVPFNMVILLFLYKNEIVSLPNNPTDLYKDFIFLTICRHLSKAGLPIPTDSRTFPEPYNTVVKQLARLSFHALNSNKLVFTSEEIQEACPGIVTQPDGTNGFGLLQAVQHYTTQTGTTTTFNFVHLTIQEYLAAHYIFTDLSQDKKLHLFREKFWCDLHANMFFMYVTISKGQQYSFKEFLSGGIANITISGEFLRDELKSLYLYKCFKEAEDDSMCKTIENATIFKKKEINLSRTNLSTTDLECVSFFLVSSSVQRWVKLDLWECNIQDFDIHIIHKYLSHTDITITRLKLRDNGLTKSSSSSISDIVLSCKVEVLHINDNHTIGENGDLYAMLTDTSSMLTELHMDHTSLSPDAAKTLFSAVKDTNKLKKLVVHSNNITGDVVNDLCTALTNNKSLVKLVMHHNPIDEAAIVTVLQAMRDNKTLKELCVPNYSPEIMNRIVEEINTKRKIQGIQDMLKVW
ncbi:NLR family CARD domain-containing protein 4-like [Dysidea avara]|uniref:NLR family CARD domain-containing protein 4-like n=1 Tax=Dysidea avara TaxID=196820 RepID=UPI0033222096